MKLHVLHHDSMDSNAAEALLPIGRGVGLMGDTCTCIYVHVGVCVHVCRSWEGCCLGRRRKRIYVCGGSESREEWNSVALC